PERRSSVFRCLAGVVFGVAAWLRGRDLAGQSLCPLLVDIDWRPLAYGHRRGGGARWTEMSTDGGRCQRRCSMLPRDPARLAAAFTAAARRTDYTGPGRGGVAERQREAKGERGGGCGVTQ